MDGAETSDAIDRISELPDFVSHNILSFLDRRSAATTSVLSKHWSSVWNSFPILQFELFIHDFYGDAEAEADAFFGIVDKAFRRLTRRNLRVQRFYLSIYYFNGNEDLVLRINQWLALALCNGAGEIFVSAYTRFYYLQLSDTVFVAKPVKGGFCPRFGSLVKLVLHYVYISESVVRNIVLQCPNVEFLELLYFMGLKDLEISKLEKLETVRLITIAGELQRVDIDAPSLKQLDYGPYDGFKLPTMSLTSCRDLRSLSLFGCLITDDWLRSHLSSFPLLETLVINGSPALRSVRVSAPRLGTLIFFDCENIEAIEIDAPSLSLFEFWGMANPALLSENVPCPMKIFHNIYYTELETPWFVNLRNNLGVSSDQEKIICLNLIDFGVPGVRIDFDKEILNDLLDEAPPKANVDCLMIGYYYMTTESIRDFMRLLDGLLWSCRPNTIFMQCPGFLADQNKCMKVLCKKLLLRGNLMYCCDANCRVKCWRHDIKAVRLQSFRGINVYGENVDVFKGIEDDPDVLLSCLNTLVNSESIQHDHEIRFRLEWN